MAKQTVRKDISLGTCYFCRNEFAKNKMTQHLKNCKERLARISEATESPQRLFHLVVEGRYRPQYWMHIELPAQATLADLDGFLRTVWVECCGHLSEFTIDGVSYSATGEDDWGGFSLLEEEDEEEEDEEGEEEEEEEHQGQASAVQPPSMEEMAKMISQDLSAELHADLKDVPVEQIEEKLVQIFAERLPPDMSASTLEAVRPFLGYMAQALQQGTLADDLEEFEEEEEGEDGIDIELSEVLAPGKKFSYLYDFGSSTELSLRVLAEREGSVPLLADEQEEEQEAEDEDEDLDTIEIVIMARNEPPALVCHVCGKPAISIMSGSEYESLDEAAFCAECAKTYEYADELLPIVNSPRVGVCGYTGDSELSYEFWDEDEEEDEEEEE